MHRSGSSSSALAERESGQQSPTVGQAAPLPFPLEAQIDASGEQVTLIQTCDWPGHSPSCIGVDGQGKLLIASFNEISVTDNRVVPNESARALRSKQAQQHISPRR